MEDLPGTIEVPSRAAMELAQLVNADALLRRPDRHVIVRGAGEMSLPPVDVLLGKDRLSFCGPFFLQGEIGHRPEVYRRSVRYPEMTIARVSDVTCLPGQVAYSRDERGDVTLLAESFNSYWERRVHGRVGMVSAKRHKLELQAAARLPGSFIYMDCQHEAHFGHFMADVLSLTWAYRWLVLKGVADLRVLITGQVRPWMHTLMEAAGVRADRLVPITAPIQVDEVYFATKAFLVQGWTSPTAYETWDMIRNALDDGTSRENIFVSRAAQGGRALDNLPAVEALFAARGYAVIQPESLSISEQVSTFANARRIAGLSGSGMFNLAYSRDVERTLIIGSDRLVHFSEQFMSAGEPRAPMSVALGRADGEDPHSPWTIDINELEGVVDAWTSF